MSKVENFEEETMQDEFFNEELENEENEKETEEMEETVKEEVSTVKEDTGIVKRIQNWFLKKWKLLLGIGVVSVVGGVIFVYWMGKKPIKIGKVDAIADRLKESSNAADVIDFAEAMEKVANDIKENPTDTKVGNI